MMLHLERETGPRMATGVMVGDLAVHKKALDDDVDIVQ